jgi:hypothetical protein
MTSTGGSQIACILLLAAAVTICAGAARAGCPNDYHRQDSEAERATNALNAASPTQRCIRAAELVRIERKLTDFVERFQVQCMLDQEVIDVQRRRLRKAMDARREACDRQP